MALSVAAAASSEVHAAQVVHLHVGLLLQACSLELIGLLSGRVDHQHIDVVLPQLGPQRLAEACTATSRPAQ